MSQKFITSPPNTVKKVGRYDDEKPKKFTRKRSDRDRSYDSKRSKEDSVCSQYIRNPTNPAPLHFNLANDSTFLFFDQPSTSSIYPSESDRKPRKTMLARSSAKESSRQQTALALKMKILETQLKAKEGDCQRFKLQTEEQRQRRRKAEFDRRSALKQCSAFQKQNDELLLQVKKLTKEKQILNKQIQFLEKINYDQKTRNIQSFREKHMQEQLLKLREQLRSQKNASELNFQKEMGHMKSLKESAQQKFRSMESLVDVQKRTIAQLKEEIFEQRLLTKERIIRSEQYKELRERFKKFIDQYKEIRNQNNSLKNLLDGKETQLVLSESEMENN